MHHYPCNVNYALASSFCNLWIVSQAIYSMNFILYILSYTFYFMLCYCMLLYSVYSRHCNKCFVSINCVKCTAVRGKGHLHSCIAGRKDNLRVSILRKDNPETSKFQGLLV
jgi:hypothetical protein